MRRHSLGYFLGNSNVISEFKKVRQPYSVDAISQIVGEKSCATVSCSTRASSRRVWSVTGLIAALSQLDKVTVYPSEANFVMLKLPFAMSVWSNLDEKHSVLVRNVSGENHLAGCLARDRRHTRGKRPLPRCAHRRAGQLGISALTRRKRDRQYGAYF